MLQVGAIASLISLVHQLHPGAWVFLQALICAVTLYFTGGVHRPTLRNLSDNWHRLRSGLIAFVTEISIWGTMALIAIGVMLILSLVAQAATPIHGYDERMYHASRVLYWIQHQTVFPFVTHNIRQTMTPFGSELFFLWPVLLTKMEVVGRLVFWLAYPLAATGQYFLLRTMKLNRTGALVGVLILLCTPLIASSAIGLKPELWSVLALLGLAYWAVSICLTAESDGTKIRYVLLGIFMVLSMNVRPFSIAIFPSLILIIWWARSPLSFARRLKAFAAGVAGAGLMSALLIPLVSNFALYHHPLGPSEVRRIVQADLTPQMMYTHAVRFVFLLSELPDVPASAETRSHFSDAANHFISSIGAGASLSGESDSLWLGKYVYALPEHSTRFSLWGLLWIPTLVIAVLLLLRNVMATWPHVRLTPGSVLSLLAIPLLGAILFGARWMTQSEVPGRFLIGPYSLLLPIGIAIAGPYFSAQKFRQALLAIIVAYAVYPPMRAQAFDAVQAIAAPVTAKALNEPFEEVVDLLPPGSRVIFVGRQDAPDYPLFSPGMHYPNTVIPWGTEPFDPARMRRLIESGKATHVLIHHDKRVGFIWLPAINTATMVSWLAQEPGLREIPLSTPRMRLFEIPKNAVASGLAFQNMAAPAAAPLITIDTALQSEVGIDPTFLKTPWLVENLGGTEGGFLWMGQGYAEGIEFGLWSRQDRTVTVRFRVSPGPSLTTPDRKVILLHDGVPVGDEQPFQGSASPVFHTRLHAGRNLLSFYTLNTATVKRIPNGDTRHLVVGLHDIQIEAGSAPEDSATRQGAPGNTGSSADDAQNSDLVLNAGKATGLISRRQQTDGYWLTSYTSTERFDHPTLEMNTYVTSLMVDLLGAKGTPVGLGGSLERARAHLHNQIEADGLVRYHGRPDGPAMTAHGLCAITPDVDDTALVWRIAPGDAALRSTALATLMRYRTADGLFKTWLGQRGEYRCIDPGADRNPTDVTIQMHMLMLLAQVEPAAAHSLCDALKRTIDQDRLWVYYRTAPLVPVLRQPDLQAAGCPVQLPLARVQATLPGQDIWLTAIQMLQRLEIKHEQAPNSAQVLDLLRALSRDDFTAVRLNPPLLYHNDFTASVPRFYWSEDVGYAIWLRLYLASERHGFLSPHGGNHKNIAGTSTVPNPS